MNLTTFVIIKKNQYDANKSQFIFYKIKIKNKIFILVRY